jgi:hypothetical protein
MSGQKSKLFYEISFLVEFKKIWTKTIIQNHFWPTEEPDIYSVLIKV